MLVLKRKINQSIILTHPALKESIKVTINKSNDGYVTLGLEAEDEVAIRRAELPPRKLNNN